MAHFDLEEQEQLEQFKHFWKTWGTLITWLVIVVLGGFAAWNGWRLWQSRQALQATALSEAVELAVQGGDAARVQQAFGDLRKDYGGTVQAAQAGLMAAKSQADAGKWDGAKATLTWVADNSSDKGYAAVARLRLASVLVQEKAYDQALAQLSGSFPPEFVALVADRKGDVLALQDKKAEAIDAYRVAWRAMAQDAEYRRLVEAKLNALGARADAVAAG
ncbi:tetratricopeptide repeat protein [Comamonas faecalis]|uniref:Ancillary SecYEG translocon subunit n=1 Tax=Comamonas faecalis TaxID=1387849 RepID=A0ABP7R809_9BURK